MCAHPRRIDAPGATAGSKKKMIRRVRGTHEEAVGHDKGSSPIKLLTSGVSFNPRTHRTVRFGAPSEPDCSRDGRLQPKGNVWAQTFLLRRSTPDCFGRVLLARIKPLAVGERKPVPVGSGPEIRLSDKAPIRRRRLFKPWKPWGRDALMRVQNKATTLREPGVSSQGK